MMMDKKIAQIVEKVTREQTNKKRECIYCKMPNSTIKSHFAPQGQWLKIIGKNKFYRLERKKFYTGETNNYKFVKRGIGEVMSLQLFCTKHDDTLFASLEKVNFIDYNDIEVQQLITFRTINALLRQAEINYDIFSQLGDIRGIVCESNIKTKLKNLLSEYKNSAIYKYELIEHDFIDICISNIWEFEGNETEIIINVFPFLTEKRIKKTYILIRYNIINDYTFYKKIIDLLNDKILFKKHLTYFMMSFPENWVISESLYEEISIDKEKLKTFMKYITAYRYLSTNTILDFNIFKE